MIANPVDLRLEQRFLDVPCGRASMLAPTQLEKSKFSLLPGRKPLGCVSHAFFKVVSHAIWETSADKPEH